MQSKEKFTKGAADGLRFSLPRHFSAETKRLGLGAGSCPRFSGSAKPDKLSPWDTRKHGRNGPQDSFIPPPAGTVLVHSMTSTLSCLGIGAGQFFGNARWVDKNLIPWISVPVFMLGACHVDSFFSWMIFQTFVSHVLMRQCMNNIL